jgi:hypothetical protein
MIGHDTVKALTLAQRAAIAKGLPVSSWAAFMMAGCPVRLAI